MSRAIRLKKATFGDTESTKETDTTEIKSMVTVNPSFLLRGIEMKKILAHYLAGKYHSDKPSDKITAPPPAAKAALGFLPMANLNGHTIEDESYVYRDKSNVSTTITTTNSKVYLAYKKGTLTKTPHICNWCRQPFTGDPVGIPVELKTFNNG